jgi:hypothetical protein
MICLSKDLRDDYVNAFARGAELPIYDYSYNWKDSDEPILIRGLGKRNIIKYCIENNRDYYYMDSGYFGNYRQPSNPKGWKYWHRIVKNGLQHTDILQVRDDRLRRQLMRIHQYKHHTNENILLVTPSEKPCKYYDIDLKKWRKETIAEIRKHTDRPIKIRDKETRRTRLSNTIYHDLQNTFAVVTYQSIAAVEAVMYGIPAFTLAPTAADPVCDKDLSLLENPTEIPYRKRYEWASSIAYGQFHTEELRNGTAWRIINETS